MVNRRELTVLNELRQNARKQFTEISRDTDIPVTTVFDYYRKLKKAFIEREVSLLNFEELGYGVKAVIIAKSEELYRYLSQEPRTNSLYRLEGGSCYAEIILRDEKNFETFKDTLSAFTPAACKVWKILEEPKRERFSPI